MDPLGLLSLFTTELFVGTVAVLIFLIDKFPILAAADCNALEVQTCSPSSKSTALYDKGVVSTC